MIESVTDIKAHFESTLDQRWSRAPVPGGHWPWLNIRWSAPGIRWAHLEEYTMTPKVHILHLVIMPDLDRAVPVYGFDLIGLSGQLTGLFVDFTPTVGAAVPATTHSFCEPRPRPDWAEFFSDHFVCVKPQVHELEPAARTLHTWLELLDSSKPDAAVVKEVAQAQHSYCVNQQKNDKTRKMLKAHIGEHKATEFVEQVLFPAHELEHTLS